MPAKRRPRRRFSALEDVLREAGIPAGDVGFLLNALVGPLEQSMLKIDEKEHGMALAKVTVDALTQLAGAAIKEDEDQDPFASGGFKSGAIPEDLREKAPDLQAITISGDDFRKYQMALVLMSQENEMQHLTARDIDAELWRLVCELFIDRDRYRDHGRRRKRVTSFVASLRKPLEEFEVVVVLENISAKARRLSVAGVDFLVWEDSLGHDWGMSGRPSLERMAEELSGSTVAIARVNAGSFERAAEQAKLKVDEALNVLRVGVIGSIYARIPDVQLLFRRGQKLAVKRLADPARIYTSYELGFRPIGFEITDKTAEVVHGFVDPIIGLPGLEAQPRLRSRLTRCLHWIGTAVTRPGHDAKLVDLHRARDALNKQIGSS